MVENPGYRKMMDVILEKNVKEVQFIDPTDVGKLSLTEDGEFSFVVGPKTVNGIPSVDATATVSGINTTAKAQG